MSTFDRESILEGEAERFRALYPRSAVRFAEIIGKRVSHVAGPTDAVHIEERRVVVADRVLMFVADRDGISDEDLTRFAAQVTSLLGDHRDV